MIGAHEAMNKRVIFIEVISMHWCIHNKKKTLITGNWVTNDQSYGITMCMDLEETSTKYHVGKSNSQLLLENRTMQAFSKYTLERNRIVTLNKPRVDSTKGITALRWSGETATC